MKEILVVVGARPQFIKAAPLCAALAEAGLAFRILHTGQHFDEGMSDVFFNELNLPAPAWNLACGGGTHGAMTGAMLAGIEKVLLEEQPDTVVVFGDTNSTLAGALAAVKLHISVAHVEAGVRSYNRAMPEELNRICTDHVADLLFCSSESARATLAGEGLTRGVHVTGDLMADVFLSTLAAVSAAPFPHAPGEEPWALLTLHRPENTESPERLAAIYRAISAWGRPVLFPVHPRTAAALGRLSLALPANVKAVAPLGYCAMTAALQHCSAVLTDSGGLQKEALWAGRPCITLRDETEWLETVACGWNTVTGANESAILDALARPCPPSRPSLYGDGNAAKRIAAILADEMQQHS